MILKFDFENLITVSHGKQTIIMIDCVRMYNVYVRVASRNRRLAHMTDFYVTIDLGCCRASAYIQQVSS